MQSVLDLVDDDESAPDFVEADEQTEQAGHAPAEGRQRQPSPRGDPLPGAGPAAAGPVVGVDSNLAFHRCATPRSVPAISTAPALSAASGSTAVCAERCTTVFQGRTGVKRPLNSQTASASDVLPTPFGPVIRFTLPRRSRRRPSMPR